MICRLSPNFIIGIGAADHCRGRARAVIFDTGAAEP
jgi:hypothetical protein